MPDIPLHPLYVGVQIGKEDVRQDMVDCLVSITEGKRQGGVSNKKLIENTDPNFFVRTDRTQFLELHHILEFRAQFLWITSPCLYGWTIDNILHSSH